MCGTSLGFFVAKVVFAGDLQLPGVASFSKLKSTELSKQLCVLDKRVFPKNCCGMS